MLEARCVECKAPSCLCSSWFWLGMKASVLSLLSGAFTGFPGLERLFQTHWLCVFAGSKNVYSDFFVTSSKILSFSSRPSQFLESNYTKFLVFVSSFWPSIIWLVGHNEVSPLWLLSASFGQVSVIIPSGPHTCPCTFLFSLPGMPTPFRFDSSSYLSLLALSTRPVPSMWLSPFLYQKLISPVTDLLECLPK